MDIFSVRQGFTTSYAKSGNDSPKTEITNSVKEAPDKSRQNSYPVNLRDVSINEINALIQAGQTELLDVVPFISPNTLEQYNYDPARIGVHRVNLLEQVEKSIEFKESIGESTSFLKKVLENLSNINGMLIPSKIDVVI